MKVKSISEIQTIQIGEKIASHIEDNVVVFLHGDLGAGKTTMVKGVLKGLGGSENDVSSPTYVYINEYNLDNAILRHIDLYRLKKDEFDDELYGLISDDEIPTVIEWPNRIGDDVMEYIKKNKKVINVSIDIMDDERSINIFL